MEKLKKVVQNFSFTNESHLFDDVFSEESLVSIAQYKFYKNMARFKLSNVDRPVDDIVVVAHYCCCCCSHFNAYSTKYFVSH